MRANRFLPVLALFLFLPVQADEGAGKASPRSDRKPAAEGKTVKESCCASESKGDSNADKSLCLKGSPAKKCTQKAATKAHKKGTHGMECEAPPAAPAAGKASPAAGAANAPGAANMVVTRDPETGELRNATVAERAKLFGGRAPLAAPVAPRVVVLPDGTEMVELGEETMSYALATRAPDGSITKSCVHGPDAATESRKASRPASRPASAPRAEER